MWDKPQSRVHLRATTEPLTTSEEMTEVPAITTDKEEDTSDAREILSASVEDTNKCYGDTQLDCLNGGICVNFTMPNDAFMLSCKCLEGFIGEKCAYSGYLLLILHEF